MKALLLLFFLISYFAHAQQELNFIGFAKHEVIDSLKKSHIEYLPVADTAKNQMVKYLENGEAVTCYFINDTVRYFEGIATLEALNKRKEYYDKRLYTKSIWEWYNFKGTRQFYYRIIFIEKQPFFVTTVQQVFN